MESVIGGAVVGKITEMTIEMAIQKLAEAAKPVVNFKKEFIWLKQELRSLKGLLQDADQQSRHSDDVRQWLDNFRDVAMQAEDIFEECTVESMYVKDAQSCGFSCSQLMFRYKMGRQIRGIKDRMRYITEKANQLRLHRDVLAADEALILPTTSQIAAVELRRSYLLPSDSHPVGIQSKVGDILNLLNDSAIPVIAVVGMGGIGKTYLLQHVYNKAKERYEKCIWLSVSQSYSISKLQCVIASHLDLEWQIREGEDICRAAELINEKLQGRRCLVVLDDVWRASREEDLLSTLGLPSGNSSQCKIVVTTRSKVVSTNLNAHVYEMQCMSDEDSWRLFCVYAFGGFEENMEPQQQQLKEAGRKIVKQCGNLPLALKTIAASLSNFTNLDRWELKLRQLENVIISAGENDPIMCILKLSYDSLPARLKACFAYISFFPEDEVIDAEYLINLWMGEGFIPAGEDQLDVAWDCLHQLANLCLLQVWEDLDLHVVDYRVGNLSRKYILAKRCKIHDLLLDLAIHISKENKCTFSVEEAFSTNASDGSSLCRVLVAKKEVDDNAISDSRPVCLRTLSLSQNLHITSIPTNFFSGMSRLRVLDLSELRFISALPASLGKMKLLKVLNLRWTSIKEVPECMRHLKSLLFLALPDDVTILPEWISELKCLQHLECRVADRMPRGISTLASLRTLQSRPLKLSMEEEELMRLEDLAKMTRLQELRLEVNNETELQRMAEEGGVLAKLANMRRLELHNLRTRVEIELPENMRAMKHLERLELWGFGVPCWICDLENLRELWLHDCECSGYPKLQEMPNLVMLWINRNRKCEEFPKAFGKSGGFPHLRFFTIYSFYEIEEFPELEEGAMACLEEFRLQHCGKVKKVGEGLEKLKRLKLFDYSNSGTNELRETFADGGEYWNKIKAVNPEVTIEGDIFINPCFI